MELPKRKGYHRHHKIPKHQGGDDTAENLIYVTPEEHAKIHLDLYEKYGRVEDALAYNSLRRHWLKGRKLDGYHQKPSHIQARTSAIDYEVVSKKLKGRVSPTKDMKFGPPKEETKRKISEALKGKKKDNSKGLMGGLRKKHDDGNYLCMCLGCRKPVSPSRLNRHKKCFEVE